MFGLEFLFAAALWALPLAALPLILHLLHRRKSPVVPFPTLRFIHSSLQQSAARRKVQRWLLLAIRMLLLALLIWAIAQPAKVLASRFFGSNESTVAVVVVDTSWSMQYRGENQISLLADADQIVQQLLRDKLRDASVMLATSSSDLNHTPFRSSSELLAQWVPLKPEPARSPLLDAVSSASEILGKNPAAQKMLVVISDFQATDFPRPLPQLSDPQLRIVALDLHPDRPRSAGVASMTIKPAQVVAGIRASLQVDIAGTPGDVRPVAISVTSLDGKQLLAKPPQMANIDDSGHTALTFDLEMPNERWQLITAKLQGEDPMPWDDSRTLAIELPPQQRVLVWDTDPALAAPQRLVRLALDPGEGRLANWPLRVETGSAIAQGQNAIVAIFEQPPTPDVARQWRDFVTAGGKLILILKPGIESTWTSAPGESRTILEALLPSSPHEITYSDLLRVVPASAARQDPATVGLADDPKALAEMRANRLVGFTISDQQSTQLLLSTAAGDRRAPADRDGLLYLRKVGRGRVYTWACIPDSVITNLGTHPLFLPLLVNQCLRAHETSLATNTVIGTPATVDEADVRAGGDLELRTPGGQVYQLAPQNRDGRRVFVYEDTREAGIYPWRKAGDATIRALTSISGPGEESEATYRPADAILPRTNGALIARSMQDLDAKITQVSQPQPRWSLPLAIVLVLLCAEGLFSNAPAVWKWFSRS